MVVPVRRSDVAHVGVPAPRPPERPAVHGDVVHDEVRDAVRRDARTERAEEPERGDPRSERDQRDRRAAEHHGKQVVLLEGPAGRRMVTPVPAEPGAVHHEPVRDRGDRLHRQERGDRDEDAHAATSQVRRDVTRRTRARL
jgi:hypothetical protein